MKMDKHQAKSLIDKYNLGDCSEKERALVESWYEQLPYEIDAPSAGQIIMAKDNVWDRLMSRRRNRLKLYYRAVMSAAAILIIGLVVFLFNNSLDSVLHSEYANEIAPGSNKATLTIAGGKTLNLNGDKTGVKVDGSELTYDDGSKVESDGLGSDNSQTLIAATPIGGTYRFILPDGTLVWLNAATTLKFPSSFKGLNNRTVELTGEGYFEVAKNKTQPFIVKTKLQEVKVLGTHFNINSYEDETSTKTTLLEGCVNVSSLPATSSFGNVVRPHRNGVILKPNQQSILTADIFQVKEADPDAVIGWKNGEFSFKIEPLEIIMRKVARWYNVDVVYADKGLAAKEFSGTISRYEKIPQVLRLLEVTGEVKFKINGRTVKVLQPQ